MGIYTVSITNEPESRMMKESDDSVLTRCGRETAILGTKTYMTQLLCLIRNIVHVWKDLKKVKRF